MKIFEELFEIAETLKEAAALLEVEDISAPLQTLEDAANELKSSFSGSWLGYHSRVYYQHLIPAPAGANFSKEWGLNGPGFSDLGSRGYWEEYQFDAVQDHIRALAGNPDLTQVNEAQKQANKIFDESKSEIISILETELSTKADPFLLKLKGEIENLEPISKMYVAERWMPQGPTMTRDMIALGQGNMVPPHIEILANIVAIRHSFGICQSASDIARKAASHLERKSRYKAAIERVGTNVFIGHGRSKVWRELKDFLQDRINLPWDEFNRVPIAGVTNIARLSQMLDAAAIAFLVLTAEDEMADGATQARMNVIHEAGLFQGRLGFTKAIVLIEDGCASFSNIEGLGQIRFPKDNIGACFEEVRRVLEREGLVDGA